MYKDGNLSGVTRDQNGVKVLSSPCHILNTLKSIVNICVVRAFGSLKEKSFIFE